MPTRSSNEINQTAANIMAQSTGQLLLSTAPKREKNPAAVALGKLGGLKGGSARAKSLTPEMRTEIARKAAQTRWKKLAD